MSVALRRSLVLFAALLVLQIASDAWSQMSTVRMSGLGYIDYRGKPRFKVGDWVKYHFTSRTDDGKTEEYSMTILISGEERFWGDDCFWVETWSGGKSLTNQETCVLMSYAAFGDTAWLQHLLVYQRKSASRGEDGGLTQELTHRVLGGKAIGDTRPSLTVLCDTAGTDTVNLPKGDFRCTKVKRKAGLGTTDDQRDSTIRIENWDRRTLFLSPRVPITSLVREIDERTITRKAWKLGKSADAVTSTGLHGIGTLDLVDWGSGGLEPRLTPMYARGATLRTGKPAGGRPAPARPPTRKRG